MASYLGKISAIVSANTAGFDAPLKRSANATRAFASSVNKELGAASRAAERSFTNILTPLQRFQKSLEAAVSQRLQFKGVEGAVQGIGQLQTRLRELERQGSGVVGVALEVSGRQTVDQLIDDLQSLDNVTLEAVVDVVNQDAISSTVARMQELRSVSDQIAKPLASAAKEFDRLSVEVQAGFVPALVDAQRGVQQLEQSIKAGGSVSEAQFEKVRQKVLQTADSIQRISEQSRLTGGLASGSELRFVAPGTVAELERAADLQRQAASLPASAISGDRQISSFIAAQRQASDEALRLRGNLEAALAAGEDTTAIEQSLARVTQRQIEYNNALERRIRDAQGETDPLVINQGASTDITAYLQLLDQIRQKEEQIADNRRRAEAANRFLVVDQRESSLLSNQGRATQLPAGFLRSSAEASARRQIGGGTDAGIRQLDQLAQKVAALRSQIDTLPATIGSQFIPQLQRAEQEFVRLRTSGTATAEQIDDAAGSVQRLGAQINRINQAQGIQSFADGLDDTALRGALGNLNALQQILNRVGATAGSDAARQFDRMRAAIQRATRDGTVGTDAFQNELRQLSQEAAKAAAATGRIGQKAAFREIQRGGDIARGGFDKLSLATQQAAFAIDDFFSATGDFTQKIRAVQNNVTQLAFILGGTTGLFIGLGVAIAAQATVALFKWINGGVEAKDRTEALNESLARQKSLVEDLKQAFDSLGDALTRGIFDEATERARELSREVQGVRESAAGQIEAAAGFDPAVQKERARQAALRDQLDEESDIGRRVFLQGQINESSRREREATDAFQRDAATIDGERIGREIAASVREVAAARTADLRRAGALTADAQTGDAQLRASLQGFNPNDLEGSASIVQRTIDDFTSRLDSLNQNGFFENPLGFAGVGTAEIGATEQELARLKELFEKLNFAIEQGRIDLRVKLLEGSSDIGESLGRSRDLIDAAGAEFGPLAARQRALAEQFDRITQELASGSSVGADGISGTSDDVKLTKAQIEARQEELDQLRKQSAELESAALSTKAFADALDRVSSQLADTVLGEAESTENKARRERNRREAELNTLPNDASPAERRRAERNLLDARVDDISAGLQADETRRRRRELRADTERAIEDFERAARAGALGAATQRDIAERDRLLEKEREGTATADDRARRRQLDANLQSDFESSDRGLALRREADRIDVDQQEFNAQQDRRRDERDRRRRSIERGSDLIKTPAQRAAEEGTANFNDAIEASLSGVADSLTALDPAAAELADGVLSLDELAGVFQRFPELRQQFEENLQVARDNIAGNIQQVVADFDRERSRLSRAPVQAQDVTTTQGRAELNRLLRGDDSNRDKPILQGIKDQIKVLKEIDRRIDEVGRIVGVAEA